jgi:hypothetical protein
MTSCKRCGCSRNRAAVCRVLRKTSSLLGPGFLPAGAACPSCGGDTPAAMVMYSFNLLLMLIVWLRKHYSN